MRIKMKVTKRASPDGKQTVTYMEGREYEVPDDQVNNMFLAKEIDVLGGDDETDEEE